MSRNRALQSDAALIEPRTRDTDVVAQSCQVTWRWTAETDRSDIPARCTDADLMRGLGYSRATFYRLKAKGAFTFLEFAPAIEGGTSQYSGHLIARWLRGELRPRESFPKARR